MDQLNLFSPALGGNGELPNLAPSIVNASACRVCGRPLYDAESKLLGMGPVCRVREGYAVGEKGPHHVGGARGLTKPCRNAIKQTLKQRRIVKATLIAFNQDDLPNPHSWHHGWILHSESGHLTVIADGFASNYGGEGPHGLAESAWLLREIEHALVRLDNAHAAAIFEGHLDPADVLPHAVPLKIEPRSDLEPWARLVPHTHDDADTLLYRPVPQPVSLFEEE